MGKIMAVDFGDARTGIAFSDITQTLVGEAFTIKEAVFERLAKRICEEALSRGAERIVLGFPKNMNGTLGVRAEKSSRLAKRLKELGAPEVVLWDERRTTVDAHRILSETGRFGRKRRETVDAVAATLILEGYLGSIKRPDAP